MIEGDDGAMDVDCDIKRGFHSSRVSMQLLWKKISISFSISCIPSPGVAE